MYSDGTPQLLHNCLADTQSEAQTILILSFRGLQLLEVHKYLLERVLWDARTFIPYGQIEV